MATKPKGRTSRTKRAREAQAPAPASASVAREQFRRAAAMWCAVIRRRITDLAEEVARVDAEVKKGGPLAAVLGPFALREVSLDLANADNAALGLELVEDDLPLPDLCGLAKALGEKL